MVGILQIVFFQSHKRQYRYIDNYLCRNKVNKILVNVTYMYIHMCTSGGMLLNTKILFYGPFNKSLISET